MKKKVLIIGTLQNTHIEAFEKDIVAFLRESEPTIVEHIPNFDLLIQTVKENPRTMMMYCPTKIPKTVKRQLNSCKFLQELLAEKDVAIGYIKLVGYKIIKRVICFDHRGNVENKDFPRKKKTNYVRRAS